MIDEEWYDMLDKNVIDVSGDINSILKEKYDSWKKFQNGLKLIVPSPSDLAGSAKSDLAGSAKSDLADISYPNLDVFSNLGNYMRTPDLMKKLLKHFKQISSGKVATFFIIGNIGVKVINKLTGPVGWIANYNVSNIENLDYQSLQIVQTDNDLFKFNLFTSLEVNKFYISVISSPFQNQTYIHEILSFILKPLKIPNFIEQLYAGIDDGSGITIMYYSNKNTLTSYLNSIKNDPNLEVKIIDILKQILLPLSVLKQKKHLFNHNDLKTNNIFCNLENDKLTVSIADYDKSSIFWHGYRFHYGYRSLVGDFGKYMLTQSIRPGQTYKISDISKTIDYANAIMINPIYYMSYDVYCIVLSIIVHPTLKRYINDVGLITNFDKLKQIVDIMFPGMWLQSTLVDVVMNGDPKKYESIKTLAQLLSTTELLINIDGVYKLLGLNAPSDYDEIYEKHFKPTKLKLGTNNDWSYGNIFRKSDKQVNYHICTSACNNNVCPSNKYSISGFMDQKIYDESKCLHQT